MMSNAAKTFDILAISLSVLSNYFDNPTRIIFVSVLNVLIYQQNRSFCVLARKNIRVFRSNL